MVPPAEVIHYSLWIGIPMVVITCIFIGIYTYRNAFIKPKGTDMK